MKGWSLLRVTSGGNIEAGEAPTVTFYARHTDKTWVALTGFSLEPRLVGEARVSAETTNRKLTSTTIFDLTGEGEDRITSSFLYNRSFKQLGVGSVVGEFSEDETFRGLEGLLTGSEKSVLKTERFRDEEGVLVTSAQQVLVPGPLKLSNITGFDGDTEIPGLIEGLLSTTQAVIQNLDTFLPTPDPEEPLPE